MREFQHRHKVWLLRGVTTVQLVHTACIMRKAVPVKSSLLHENAASSEFSASYDTFEALCTFQTSESGSFFRMQMRSTAPIKLAKFYSLVIGVIGRI